MKSRFEFVKEALEARQRAGQLRSLSDIEKGTYLINVCGNDYLGLSKHPQVINYSQNYLMKSGAGSTASRLIAGTSSAHIELEKELATWLERESVLLFNSGFQMNSSLIGALADKNTHLYYDKFNHNSLIQGAVLSRASLHRYRHCDTEHLRMLIKKNHSAGKRQIIVTESVFSMDGDVPDLPEISNIAQEFDAILIVDEAHAIGLWGPGGRGFTFGDSRVDMVLGTFGKAFGSFGAFAACSEQLKSYLVNFCPGFVYTTALPPATIGATLGALKLMPTLDDVRSRVIDLSSKFRSELTKHGFDISGSTSQIIPVVIGSEEKTLELAQKLQNSGFQAYAVRPPTVAAGRSRIRFTITAELTEKHIDQLIAELLTS